ncbi:MAG: stage 0 sporulation protein [Chloroflexi bacterium]|nr:regulatory iron-sulfur-containing complex subunit RicT [Chloroflexota bacterium]MQC26870.1 stage 0 sporulation protein [Chloroflexota bacterium]
MAELQTPLVAGIRFQKIGKLYHFDASQTPDLKAGDFAIVQTSRGVQIGQVVQMMDDPPKPEQGGWKSIDRKATPSDLLIYQEWQKKEVKAMIDCRAKASALGIEGVKIVKAEFSFDGAGLTFLYNAEDDGEINLEELRTGMQREYRDSKIELRRIGPRDVAKILGGMGACGLESRCCSTFLTEFSPISIKMAKAQGISLDPAEITGMCGRLRCCLVYEYEQYVEARKVLPKRGKKVITPMGEGKVVDVYPLKQAVIVNLVGGPRAEFLKHELEPWDELEALRRKSAAPCDRHENGGCDCGKANYSTKKPKTDD